MYTIGYVLMQYIQFTYIYICKHRKTQTFWPTQYLYGD